MKKSKVFLSRMAVIVCILLIGIVLIVLDTYVKKDGVRITKMSEMTSIQKIARNTAWAVTNEGFLEHWKDGRRTLKLDLKLQGFEIIAATDTTDDEKDVVLLRKDTTIVIWDGQLKIISSSVIEYEIIEDMLIYRNEDAMGYYINWQNETDNRKVITSTLGLYHNESEFGFIIEHNNAQQNAEREGLALFIVEMQ